MEETEEESAIADFLHILEEHRKNCEQQGKYVEAEVAKNRLEELRVHEDNRQKDAMQARQITEKFGVDEAHILELQQFNKAWDKKILEHDTHAEGLIAHMKERHTKELGEFQDKILGRQQKPKFSTELLNYRKIEERLAKSKQYNEAHKIKAKADILEEVETERWTKRRRKEMNRQENQFKNTKLQELATLQKRIQTGREGQKKQRHITLERLLQRYQNVKNELETQQNKERINREKQITVVLGVGGVSMRRKKKANKADTVKNP